MLVLKLKVAKSYTDRKQMAFAMATKGENGDSLYLMAMLQFYKMRRIMEDGAPHYKCI